MPEEHTVVISYAHEDRGFVEQLAVSLRAAGVNIWYDAALVPGRPWSAETEDKLRSARAVVLALSPASADSAYVRKEIYFA